MKYFKFLSVFLFITLLLNSCQYESVELDYENLRIPITPVESGIIHTSVTEDMCIMLNTWKVNETSLNDALVELYDSIFLGTFITYSSLDRDTVEMYMDQKLNLNRNNISQWSVDSISLTTVGDSLYSDIMDMVEANVDSSDFTLGLIQIQSDYQLFFDSTELASVLEISKSSYFYWYSNYDDCVGQYVFFRAGPCANAVVGGDIRGAIGGIISSAWSGLGVIGGAAIGAMVGTLVGSVEIAITGACQ